MLTIIMIKDKASTLLLESGGDNCGEHNTTE